MFFYRERRIDKIDVSFLKYEFGPSDQSAPVVGCGGIFENSENMGKTTSSFEQDFLCNKKF